MARTTFRPSQDIDSKALAHFHDTTIEALRHLRLALGTGSIFYGFDVRLERASSLLHVSPGLAFDGVGQPVALDSVLSLPAPDEDGPLWLCLRHHLLVDEQGVAGQPARERDSVEVVWLPDVPRDDETIPLARVQRGPAGWLVDGSVARRAPSLAHRHTGQTLPDRSGRLRYDGTPVRLSPIGAEEYQAAPPWPSAEQIERLERAIGVEFAKINGTIAELREESKGEEGWREAIAALRDELSLTIWDEVREELETLRAELLTLSKRPHSMGGDAGAFTPVTALHGVGDKYARVLHEAGIETVSDLLIAAASPEARDRLEAADLSVGRLRRWTHEADLLRLHGVGPNEVILLDDAGINNVAQLTSEEPRALFDRLREAAHTRETPAPPLAWVESWTDQARHLPPVVEW
ncbi:MAG: DUF4332 domain-containing protein [Ardenticatenaceae bacterium]